MKEQDGRQAPANARLHWTGTRGAAAFAAWRSPAEGLAGVRMRVNNKIVVAVCVLGAACASEIAPASETIDGSSDAGESAVDVAMTTGADSDAGGADGSTRVPAEWEPQAAVWLQWPRSYESTYEEGLAKVVATTIRYEDMHILTHDMATRNAARTALETQGGLSTAVADGAPTPEGFRTVWHMVPNDNAWMRDNGPRYVIQDGVLRIQNWEFNAWGGAFGKLVTYTDDNSVPDWVGQYLGLPVDPVPIVHERGDLEFNGHDGVILNWTVIGDPNRNPGITEAQVVEAMQQHFGVSRVVLIDGAPTGDLTGGHVDGIARFIDADRVVVADCSTESACQPGDVDDQIFDGAAAEIEAAGFTVIRWPFEGKVTFQGQVFDTDYLNWMVGNGFVITVGFGHLAADANAKAQLESWFPGRDVYVIEMLESWNAGGGVHCHTNDQPLAP